MDNPYAHVQFLNFVFIFIKRLWLWANATLSFEEIASDELQILVLLAIACSASLVGSFLVLKKMTMVANALSHTMLLGIVTAYLCLTYFSTIKDPQMPLGLGALLIASLITGFLTTFLIEFFTKKMKVQEDASIGLIFTMLFALGIVFVSVFTKNAHLGTELVMGNVDALNLEDLKNVYIVLGINTFFFVLFFKEFKLITFDSALAKSLGFSPAFFTYLLMMLTSLTAVGAFRSVGVLMVLGFLVIPPLTARLWTHTLSTLIVIAMGISCLASFLGVALSRHLLTIYDIGFSTAGLIVSLLFIFFILTLIFAPQKGLIAYYLHRRKLIKAIK